MNEVYSDEYRKWLDELDKINLTLGTIDKSHPKRADYIRQKIFAEDSLRKAKEARKQIIFVKRGVIESNRDEVSDHAVIRWLERKHKIDVDKIKAIIYNEMRRGELNSHNQVVYGDHVFVLSKDNTIVTVLDLEDASWQTR